MTKNLYVDLDGTLAVWRQASSIEELYEAGYYADLPEHSNVADAIRIIMRERPDITVRTMSAYFTDSAFALRDKHTFIDRVLPALPADNRIFVPYGKNKADYIAPGDKQILLDDYTRNLMQWRESGYSGIKLITDINHTRGTWDGPFVDFSWAPETIASKIVSIIDSQP